MLNKLSIVAVLAALAFSVGDARANCPKNGPLGELCARMEALQQQTLLLQEEASRLTLINADQDWEINMLKEADAELAAQTAALDAQSAQLHTRLYELESQGAGCGMGEAPVCCPIGMTFCPVSGCSDLWNESNNCGACGHQCLDPAICIEGECVLTCLSGDSSVCGYRGDICLADGTCSCGGGPACSGAICIEGECLPYCGQSAEYAAPNCQAIQESCGGSTGLYWIKALDGSSVQVICDMETDGGGWALCASSALNTTMARTWNNNEDSNWFTCDRLLTSTSQAMLKTSASGHHYVEFYDSLEYNIGNRSRTDITYLSVMKDTANCGGVNSHPGNFVMMHGSNVSRYGLTMQRGCGNEPHWFMISAPVTSRGCAGSNQITPFIGYSCGSYGNLSAKMSLWIR